MWPIVITSTFGERIFEEIAWLKPKPPGDPALLSVLVEDGSDLRQVEADALEVSVVRRILHGEISLSGADIHDLDRSSRRGTF